MVECTGIQIVHDRNAGDLTVARIGRTLAVRAVAGDATVHVVGLATPPDAVDHVEQFVRAGEVSRRCNVRIDGFGGQLIRVQFAGPSAELHFAEYVPCEAGMVGFVAASVQRVAVRSDGRFADVFDVDPLSGLSREIVQMEPSRNLLSEVDAVAALTQFFDPDRFQPLHHPIRRGILCHEFSFRSFAYCNGFPRRIIEARSNPSRLFETCIVVLAGINHIRDDSTFARFP